MNGKKAKAIRRLAKAHGHFKKEPEYKVKETKKMVYYNDKDGKPQAQQVSRFTVYNASRTVYRRMKRAYNDGLIAV